MIIIKKHIYSNDILVYHLIKNNNSLNILYKDIYDATSYYDDCFEMIFKKYHDDLILKSKITNKFHLKIITKCYYFLTGVFHMITKNLYK